MSYAEVTVTELEDWVRNGAHWRVVEIAQDGADVQLCTCTDEPMELRHTSDPAVIDYLRTAHAEFDEQ